MRRTAVLLLILTACASNPPAPAPAPAASTPAPATTVAAGVDPQIRGAIEQLTAAVTGQPGNMPWTYLLATYHDRAKDADGVVKWLTRLDELGWTHGVAPHDFRNSDTPAFRAIAAKLDARVPRVNKAAAMFTLTGQRDLVPEGIAWDPMEDVFYVSGIHRRNVLRIGRRGDANTFVAEEQDGMLGGLGLKVDATRRLLWVISTTTPEMRGYEPGNEASMLALYDLRDGQLVRKIDASPAGLNDLALLADGSLFATDMRRGNVVRLAPEGTTLEIWASEFQFPNGIAIDTEEKNLYVADFRGITRFEIATKARTRIESKELLNGIDGLSWDRGKLIAIQNAIGRPRVIRIDPANGNVDVLESMNPRFELPTTGAVAGDEYFFIANPGLRFFDQEDPVMLRLLLRR